MTNLSSSTGSPSRVSSPARADGLAYDVTIIGAGAAGAAAAVALGRRGIRTALVDMHATCPSEFRAEKVAGDQIELTKELGLFDCLSEAGQRIGSFVNIRANRLVDRGESEAFNLPYADLVNAIRARIPEPVHFIVDRVARVSTSDTLQVVELSSGERLVSRLIVLATGHGDAIRESLGIRKHVIRAVHSVSFGFDLHPGPDADPDFECLTAYGHKADDAIDYVSIFPFRRGLRANLFVYRPMRDALLKSIVADPRSVLLEKLPGLKPYLGTFDVIGKVSIRPMDLYEVDGYLQPGVVLLGDAFRSGCPAVGHGLSRSFNDVKQLCNVHIPTWLATPGMATDKIAAFYADPIKKAFDERASNTAEYRRRLTTDKSLRWTLHRSRVFLQRQIRWRASNLLDRSLRGRASEAADHRRSG